MGSCDEWTKIDIISFIITLLVADLVFIGAYSVCRMYGRRRYIISHFHDTVSSFFSYMGDSRYCVFVFSVIVISQALVLSTLVTWKYRDKRKPKQYQENWAVVHIVDLIAWASFICAVLTNLLIFPLKLGSQRCRIVGTTCTPGRSYWAHYVGGVAFLLVDPLIHFVAYLVSGFAKGFELHKVIVIAIFGSALLFGLLSLSTKHPICTRHICCGAFDPEERTERSICQKKAFPKFKGPMTKAQLELKAIADAEAMLRVLKEKSQREGGAAPAAEATADSSKEDDRKSEKREDIPDLSVVTMLGDDNPSGIQIPVLSSGAGTCVRNDSEDAEHKGIAHANYERGGGEEGSPSGTVAVGDEEKETPSLGQGQLASTIKGSTQGEGSSLGEGEGGGGGGAWGSIDTKIGDLSDIQHPPGTIPFDVDAPAAMLPDSSIQLKESRRPFLRLWSTGTELVAIALIVAGNVLISCEEFSRLGFY
eukprot:jgi/Bigna1/145459/aug1.99_g20167